MPHRFAAQPPPSRRRRTRGLLAMGATGGIVVLVISLAACTGSHTSGSPKALATSSVTQSGSGSTAPPSTSASVTTPAGPTVITASLATGATHVNPAAPVSVSVANGTLTSVVLTSESGSTIAGAIAAGGASWHATHALAYSKTYKITATATNSAQQTSTKTVSFTTLTPGNMTMPYMSRIGGYGLYSGDTYGVAIVPVVHFDEQITDEVAAQKALSVDSSPQVAGAWYWLDDTDVAYRPQNYWASGTKVTVHANLFGVEVGPGLYGQADASTSFIVGRKQLTVAYDNSPKIDKVYVYDAAGKVLRTMDTSMGQHGGETVGGTYINFYTLNGNYTVLDHENPANMSSESYGLPAGDAHGYGTIFVPYSTKISIDGIYLHEYNSTIYDQEHGLDVSEGCLNLKTSDAVWFFDHSIAGDPVIVHGAKHAPTIKLSQGGEWSVPWSTWVAGNASS